MGKNSQISIIGKRVNGNKISYHVQKDGEVSWVQYSKMIDHIDLVIEYEKNRKVRNKGGLRKKRQSEAVNIQIDEDEEDKILVKKEEGDSPKKQVKRIEFLKKKDGKLMFKVTFKEGNFWIMTSKQLRKEYPLKLLDFYESHVNLCFD